MFRVLRRCHLKEVTGAVRGRKPLSDVPFKKARIGMFMQNPPKLQNPWETDLPLQLYLKRTVKEKSVLDKISLDLARFGDRIVFEIDGLGRECEEQKPTIEHFDGWGRRIDRLVTCSAWKKMKVISAEEGLIASGYDPGYLQFNRISQYAKLYLFVPSSGMYACPLAMTDGAAKVLKALNLNGKYGDHFERLTSRDPQRFWTSGQWMTERRGGSDVSGGTETIALPLEDSTYSLHGYKWFSSATDADMALALGRLCDKNNIPIQADGGLNRIEIVRLKDKLGTRQMPTAELLLDGTIAHKICEEGRGVASIAHMLNITRIHNSLSAVAAMRRIVSLARDYMDKRVVFGKELTHWPLHLETLCRMEVETRGCLLLVMEIARLLGLQEANMATSTQSLLLRLLTPVVKLYTGKLAVWTVSEGLECFGGQGYIEDTGIPSLLRDAQVYPIWEGTTNILSLDVLRHLSKEGDLVLKTLKDDIEKRLSLNTTCDKLKRPRELINVALRKLLTFPASHPRLMEIAARDFAFTIAELYIGALLIEQTMYEDSAEDEVNTALRWCEQKPLFHLKTADYYSLNPAIRNNEEKSQSRL